MDRATSRRSTHLPSSLGGSRQKFCPSSPNPMSRRSWSSVVEDSVSVRPESSTTLVSPPFYLIVPTIKSCFMLLHHRLCYRSARSALDAEMLMIRFTSYQGPSREQHRHDPHQPQHRYHSDIAPPRLADLLPARHRRLCRLCAREGAPGWDFVDLRWTVGPQRRYSTRQDGCAGATGRAGAGYPDQDARGVRGPRPLRSSAER